MEIFKQLEGKENTGLPSKEELRLAFPHAEGCSKTEKLVAGFRFINVSSGDPRVGTLSVRSYFLRCDRCDIEKEYQTTNADDEGDKTRFDLRGQSSNGDW
jgi:hypothetical protein